MPRLRGKGKNVGRPPRLQELPTDSNGPGAPRIFALGKRVRVPVHTLWLDEKFRETGGGSSKAGTQVQQRKTYVDALFALNDRKTKALTHFVGNGKLLLMRTLNLVSVESSQIVVSVSGDRLVLTMASNLDP